MKKILALLLALVMVFALAACGGEESAPETEAAPAVTEAAAAETEEFELTVENTGLTIGFMGAGDDGVNYYVAFDDEVSYGVMVLLSEDATETLNVVGEVVEDENGILTIVDSYDDISISFAVSEIDGGVMLTMADGSEVVLGVVDPAEVLEAIAIIDEHTAE